MEFTTCIRQRRSIRNYIDKPVEKEVLTKLIEAAQLAPSWKNSQVGRYYIAHTLENKAKAVGCLANFNQKNAENAAAIIVSTVVKNRSGFERDGSYSTHLKEGFQYFDNGLQVENLCLQAYELGLGTLIMGLYDEPALRDLFQIPADQDIVAVIAVGYYEEEPEMPKRKALEDISVFI